MEGKKDIRGFMLKKMHKINGILFEISEVNSNMLSLVIVKSKSRYVRFIAYGDIADKIKANFKLRGRIKIRFFAISKKYKDRWYTDLIVFDVFEWKKNEKKIAMQESLFKAEEESKYAHPKFDWGEEVDKFNKAKDNQ